MSKSPFELGLISAPTAIARRTRQGIFPGIALPAENTVDVYLSPYRTEATLVAELQTACAFYAAALLGALSAYDFSCTPHTEESLQRLDHQGVVNAVLVEAAEQILVDKGQKHHTLPVTFSQLQLASTISEALCTPHATPEVAWRRRVMRALQAAGGLGAFTIWEGLTIAHARDKQLFVVPDTQVTADKSSSNFIFADGFDKQVKPRIEAAKIQPEQAARLLVAGSQDRLPAHETVLQVVGRRTKLLFRGN